MLALVRNLLVRWYGRNLPLVCPHCQKPADPTVFRRARYLAGDRPLTCDGCGQSSLITLWRFEGVSRRGTTARNVMDKPNSSAPSGMNFA
jgi:hypothetical protein